MVVSLHFFYFILQACMDFDGGTDHNLCLFSTTSVPKTMKHQCKYGPQDLNICKDLQLFNYMLTQFICFAVCSIYVVLDFMFYIWNIVLTFISNFQCFISLTQVRYFHAAVSL
uniref:Uncharacterized protein n=1 Tax=Anguilla anguilla TaxID=7936 RepID=A0A0E9WZN3_ANGAN